MGRKGGFRKERWLLFLIFNDRTKELCFDYHSSSEISYSFRIVHFTSPMWLHHTFFKKEAIGNKSKTSSCEAILKPKFLGRINDYGIGTELQMITCG